MIGSTRSTNLSLTISRPLPMANWTSTARFGSTLALLSTKCRNYLVSAYKYTSGRTITDSNGSTNIELAKPFEPPTSATPLRFRYTSYLGEEHPAARKVIVEFTPGDLDLTEKQQIKLIKLVRSRYNPETDTIKISCERYEHPAQNKKWLSDRVDLLIGEARVYYIEMICLGYVLMVNLEQYRYLRGCSVGLPALEAEEEAALHHAGGVG